VPQRRNPRSGVEDRWSKVDGTPSAKHGKGSRWRARWVDADGDEQEKLFRTKVEATKFLAEVTSSIVTGTYVAPGAGNVTVAVLKDQWVTTFGHLKATTKATRETTWNAHVRDRWGTTPVNEIQTSAVRSWVQQMTDAGTKPATIENALGVLRGICALAVEDRRLARNPVSGVKAPRREHVARAYLTHGQVAQLADTIDGRYEVVVLMLAYTGLRFGELAALRVQDFDMLRRRVNVRQSVTEVGKIVWSSPKNHERRSVPFPRFLADPLAAVMVGKGRDDLVFTAAQGGVLRLNTWRRREFGPAVEDLRPVDDDGKQLGDFPTVTPHDLRHTAASLAISAGANVKAVQTMLGHKSAALTLDTYADLFPDDLERVADALDDARSKLLRANCGPAPESASIVP